MINERLSSDHVLQYKGLPDNGLSDFQELRSTPEGRKVLEERLTRSFITFASSMYAEVPVHLRPGFRIDDVDLGRKLDEGTTKLFAPIISEFSHF